MVADFTAAPVAADKLGEEGGVARRVGAYVVGLRLGGWRGGGLFGALLLDQDEAADVGQGEFERIGGKDFYGAQVEAAVGAVRGFAGKRGEPAAAVAQAWAKARG